MVIYSKKIAYIHIRKCAGCSVIEAFKRAGYPLEWDTLNFGAYPVEAILAPRKEKFGKWDRETYKDYKIFATIRNPFDRLVSGYHYSQFGQSFGSNKPLKFSEFIRQLPTRAGNFTWWTHLRMPMSSMLYDGEGLIVDRLVRFENLNEEFESCCKWLGVKGVKLKKTNVSRPNNEYRSLYTSADKQLVYKIFEKDFDNFGYSF